MHSGASQETKICSPEISKRLRNSSAKCPLMGAESSTRTTHSRLRSRSSFSILARRSISRPSGANGSSSGLMSALRVTQNTTFSSVLYISNTLSA